MNKKEWYKNRILKAEQQSENLGAMWQQIICFDEYFNDVPFKLLEIKSLPNLET